jgi:hypothetical protein
MPMMALRTAHQKGWRKGGRGRNGATPKADRVWILSITPLGKDSTALSGRVGPPLATYCVALTSRPRRRLSVHGASDYQISQRSIERVLGVCEIEAMVTVASTRDQLGGLEFRELILDRLEREKTQARQFADIQLLLRIREQQTENLRADHRKQSMEQRFAHSGSRIT